MRIPIFDLDGTLLDSDDALVRPFVALGVPRQSITFGHVLADECERLGVELDTYLDLYDEEAAQPFPGVDEMVSQLDRWAVCSNKHPRSGRAELARLGWSPSVAAFADAFDGPKRLPPVLERLGSHSGDAVFVGDTAHDRHAAAEAGVAFALAAWNPRARPAPGDLVLHRPIEVFDLLQVV